MSPLSALFGARSRKSAASLASVLFRLLGGEGEGEPPQAARKRREAEPELAASSAAKWAEAAAGASGELVALRSDLTGSSLALLGTALSPGDRELFLGAAAALAELASAGEGAAPGFIATAERASPASLALLRGRVGGGRFFAAREGSLLVHVDEALALAVEAALAADPGLYESLGPGDPAAIRSPAAIAVDKPMDFVLSHFFMPPLFPAGPAGPAGSPPPPEAAVFWDEIGSQATPRGEALWFIGSLGDPKAGLALAFECPAPPGADKQAYAARILPILREGWGRAAQRLVKLAPAPAAGAAPPEPRFGLIAAAPEAFLRGAVRLGGELRVGSGGFPLGAFLPSRLLALLAAALRPRPETPGEAGPLLDLVSANEALLERWAPGHREPLLRPRGVAGRAASAPPLASLLSAFGRRDAAVAVQNCLLPRFGSQEFAYLFYYHAPFVRNGKRAMRPCPFVLFREAEITGLLPQAAREEWEQERRFDLPRRTVPVVDCVAANEEAAKLLWDAARSGKIELSPGSYELLEEKVGKRLAEAARAKLDALASKDVPFGFLAALEKRDATRIVDRLANKDLALACVGDKRHVDLLHSAMGSGRRRDFDEELAIAEARIERGEAGVEAAAAMKLELLERMKEYAEDQKRERAALSSPQEPERPAPRQAAPGKAADRPASSPPRSAPPSSARPLARPPAKPDKKG